MARPGRAAIHKRTDQTAPCRSPRSPAKSPPTYRESYRTCRTPVPLPADASASAAGDPAAAGCTANELPGTASASHPSTWPDLALRSHPSRHPADEHRIVVILQMSHALFGDRLPPVLNGSHMPRCHESTVPWIGVTNPFCHPCIRFVPITSTIRPERPPQAGMLSSPDTVYPQRTPPTQRSRSAPATMLAPEAPEC